jgi:uncharacterized membrane protein
MYNYSRPSGETSLGIDERWERVLAYALLWVSGLILLIVEQRNQAVRRHAKQSVIIFGVLTGLAWLATAFGHLLGWIPILGFFFGLGFGLLHFVVILAIVVLWVLLMALAYSSAKTLFVGPRQDRML